MAVRARLAPNAVILNVHDNAFGYGVQHHPGLCGSSVTLHVGQSLLDRTIDRLGELRRKQNRAVEHHLELYLYAGRFGKVRDQPANRRFGCELFERRGAQSAHRTANVLEAVQRQPPGATHMFQRGFSTCHAELIGSFELHVATVR